MGVADGRLLVATRPKKNGPWLTEHLPIKGITNNKLGLFITAFGEDNDGEIFILTNNRGNPGGTGGKVWKMVSAEK
jgi:hypothetical protein